MKTYIIGHINPDTDSVVSAIAFSFLKEKLSNKKEYEPVVSGEINKETAYVLGKYGFSVPATISEDEKKVVLVDHNEPSQISPKIKIEEIVGIIDHHKLGGLSTPEPIVVIANPVGSTATIIANMFKKEGIEIPKNIASILVCAIISDTLKFGSPTTTEKDRKTAEELNRIAQIDINKTAEEMFEAKSDISDISTEELLSKDYKVFDMAGKKVGIGVWETTNPNSILERKQEIHKALKDKKEKEGLDHIFFAAIDIIEGAAHFILDTDPEISLIADAFGVGAKEGVAYAKGIVSRKKQIAPKIEESLK